jgi:hypothetical protein
MFEWQQTEEVTHEQATTGISPNCSNRIRSQVSLAEFYAGHHGSQQEEQEQSNEVHGTPPVLQISQNGKNVG